MSNETGRVEVYFTSDSRLLAGVAGAVNHVAEAAGMSEHARAQMVAAVEDACQEALREVAKGAEVGLSVEELPGTVEAVLEFKAGSKAPSGGSASGAAKGKESGGNLDSVRRETKGEQTRIILSKKILA